MGFFISELFTQVILGIFIAIFTGLGLWFKKPVFAWLTLGIIISSLLLNLYKYQLEKNKINDFRIEITLYLAFPTSYVGKINTTDNFGGFLGYKDGENTIKFVFQQFTSIAGTFSEYLHSAKFFKITKDFRDSKYFEIPPDKTHYAYMMINKTLQLRNDPSGIGYIPKDIKESSMNLLKKIDSMQFSFSFTKPVLAGLEDKNLIRGDAFIRIFVNDKKTEFYLNKKPIKYNDNASDFSDLSDLLADSNTKNPEFHIKNNYVGMHLYFPENLYKLLHEKK